MYRVGSVLLRASRTNAILRSRTILFFASASPIRGFATHTTTPSIRSLKPSVSELAARKLGPRNIRLALEALQEDGIVALEGVVGERELDAVGFYSLFKWICCTHGKLVTAVERSNGA